MAKYLDLRNDYNKNDLLEAAKCIKQGKLVLFPTETVYGIGANGLDDNAIKKIFVAKNRAQDNPLILHVSNLEMIEKVADELIPLERRLINDFFPGPLTIILKRKGNIPNSVTAGLDTVGVRMPSNRIARDLIELADTPIAAPSANMSGKPSGTNIQDVFNELNDKVDYIIDGGDAKIGLESTVIRIIDNKINILRPGKITYDDLIKYAPVIIDSHILGTIQNNEKVLSPGMKYRHYAPNTKCVLIYSKSKDKLINEMKKFDKDNNLIITNDRNISLFNNAIGYGKTLDEISHNIFKVLRRVDKENKKLIIIEGVKSDGLGLAIMNRLIRACSHNYIEI